MSENTQNLEMALHHIDEADEALRASYSTNAYDNDTIRSAQITLCRVYNMVAGVYRSSALEEALDD